MKRIISVVIAAITLFLLTLTACAAQPQVTDAGGTVSVAELSEGDVAIAAVYDRGRKLIGAHTYRGREQVELNCNDIIKKYSDAQYLKLFVWKENMEPKMTAYETDLSVYRDKGTESRDISITVGTQTISATLADNSSADAFLELLKKGDVTVDMSDYGGFEKVGALPESIVRNDEQITTEPGDIILYQGNQITIYYGVNTWSFTKLGHVNGLSQAELKTVLGSGGVTAVFSLAARTSGNETETVTLNSGYKMPVLGLGTWTQDDETAAICFRTIKAVGMEKTVAIRAFAWYNILVRNKFFRRRRCRKMKNKSCRRIYRHRHLKNSDRIFGYKKDDRNNFRTRLSLLWLRYKISRQGYGISV